MDEEYFYARHYPLVGFLNDQMGKILLGDLTRRAKKPQIRAVLRHLLKDVKRVTPGGILLPPSLVRVEYDVVRVQRVAVKIAQCISYKEHGRFMPRKNCEHIEVCEKPTDLQELFADLCRLTEGRTVDPNVFGYWHAEYDGLHYYAMLYWGAFMYCMAFRDPDTNAGDTGARSA
jgi:hypothetical protein